MNEKSSAHVINYTPIVFTKKDHLMGRIEFFQPCYENSLRPLHKLTVWSCSTQYTLSQAAYQALSVFTNTK